MTTKVTKSGVGAIDQLSTGSVKHASSPVNNITLDASGNVILPYGTSLAFNGIANQYVYADADNLYLGTSNLGRLKIDTSGRVTMPYQPAFQTSEYEPGSISASTMYVFKTTAVHNVGNYYNSSTGKFTAPVAGMYNFNFVVTPSSATSSPAVWIRLNNGATRYGLCLAYNAGYNGVSCSPNIYMNINDYVEPIIQEWNGGTALSIWSAQFGGFLIG